MRKWIALLEAYEDEIDLSFGSDDDCWIDETGHIHELQRDERETHRTLAIKILQAKGEAVDAADANKVACAKGWLRVWIQGRICFLEMDFGKVSRRAVRVAIQLIKNVVGINTVWIDDSVSRSAEQIDDVRTAMQRLNQIVTKRELGAMFETYTEPNTYLRKYMNSTNGDSDFDHHRFWWVVIEWINESGEREEIEDAMGHELPELETHEVDDDVWNAMGSDLQQQCQDWCMDYIAQHAPDELPSSQFFTAQNKLMHRLTWLVHFTDHADDIHRNGFTHGTYDPEALGLTTHRTHSSKKMGGYNFAFEALSGDAEWAASNNKYGKNAILFQNSGVKAWHSGDEENQVIFWGPDVDKRRLIILTQEYGEFTVNSRIDGRELCKGEYEDVVKWVIANERQYARLLYGK